MKRPKVNWVIIVLWCLPMVLSLAILLPLVLLTRPPDHSATVERMETELRLINKALVGLHDWQDAHGLPPRMQGRGLETPIREIETFDDERADLEAQLEGLW